MSGGVDSSVAAGLLAEAGHEVVGVSMQLYDNSSGFGTCCTIDDLHDARRVAAHLGFPHYIVNFESHFHRHVQQNFVDEYARGRTPIPCAHCNSEVKFSELLLRAGGYGASHLATGHYARIERDDTGRMHLARGRDRAKDQSYFLFSLTQAQLAQALFPVGDLAKDDVRLAAVRMGLAVAGKPDSQEICFVPDGDYAGFLERETPALATTGAIVNQQGETMGAHGGVHRFTVGQRKGLGLSAGVPLYVVQHRRRAPASHGGPARGAGARGLHRVTRELGRRRRSRQAPSPPRCRSAIVTRPPQRTCGHSTTAAPRSCSRRRSRPSHPARRRCSTTGMRCSGAGGSTERAAGG